MRVEDVPTEWVMAARPQRTSDMTIFAIVQDAIAHAAPLIQQAERERCAMVVQRWEGHDPKLVDSIAAAVLAGKVTL